MANKQFALSYRQEKMFRRPAEGADAAALPRLSARRSPFARWFLETKFRPSVRSDEPIRQSRHVPMSQ
jgi:hypothetical protein